MADPGTTIGERYRQRQADVAATADDNHIQVEPLACGRSRHRLPLACHAVLTACPSAHQDDYVPYRVPLAVREQLGKS
jgi:hypothetical protein